MEDHYSSHQPIPYRVAITLDPELRGYLHAQCIDATQSHRDPAGNTDKLRFDTERDYLKNETKRTTTLSKWRPYIYASVHNAAARLKQADERKPNIVNETSRDFPMTCFPTQSQNTSFLDLIADHEQLSNEELSESPRRSETRRAICEVLYELAPIYAEGNSVSLEEIDRRLAEKLECSTREARRRRRELLKPDDPDTSDPSHT